MAKYGEVAKLYAEHYPLLLHWKI